MLIDLLGAWLHNVPMDVIATYLSNTCNTWSDTIGLAYQVLMPILSGFILIMLVASGVVKEAQ